MEDGKVRPFFSPAANEDGWTPILEATFSLEALERRVRRRGHPQVNYCAWYTRNTSREEPSTLKMGEKETAVEGSAKGN